MPYTARPLGSVQNQFDILKYPQRTKNNEIMKNITYEAKDSIGNHKLPLLIRFVTICSRSVYPFWEFNADYSVLQPVAQSQYRLGKSLAE